MTLHAECAQPSDALAAALIEALQAATKVERWTLRARLKLPNDGKVIADERPVRREQFRAKNSPSSCPALRRASTSSFMQQARRMAGTSPAMTGRCMCLLLGFAARQCHASDAVADRAECFEMLHHRAGAAAARRSRA